VGGELFVDHHAYFEDLTGTSGDDTLTGNADSNVIHGGSGNDTIEGMGASNADTLFGEDGTDTLSYAHSAYAVHANIDDSSLQILAGAIDGATVEHFDASTLMGTDTVHSFENLIGSDYADLLFGTATANVIQGGSGNDALFGNGGADTLSGGAGDDTFAFQHWSADMAATTITDFTSGADKIHFDAFFGNYTGLAHQGQAAWEFASTEILSQNNYNTSDPSKGALVYESSSQTLYYDQDGNGTEFNAVAVAQVHGNAVQESDITVFIGY